MNLKRRLSLIVKNNPLDVKLLRKFIVAFIAIVILSMLFVKVTNFNVDKYLNDISGSMFKNETPFSNFIHIFINNTISLPIGTFIVAIIPIPYLFLLNFVRNAFIIGVCLYTPFVDKDITFLNVISSIIWHGIPELLALFITFSVALYINRTVCQKVYKGNQNLKLKTILFSSFKIYIIYALPLFFIAAIIEAYITPHLIF